MYYYWIKENFLSQNKKASDNIYYIKINTKKLLAKINKTKNLIELISFIGLNSNFKLIKFMLLINHFIVFFIFNSYLYKIFI